MADLARTGHSILARRMPGAQQSGLREFLSFRLGNDAYAVELARIREIVSSPPVTEVPRSPSDIVGICSVRGLLVTVVDLRQRLGLPEAPATRLSRILLTNTDSGEVVGLLVDEVRHVIRLSSAEIEVTGSVLGADLSDHVLGVGRPDGDFVVLLDLASMVET
ncbi:MAG TPA: chemotaxis protein CheW [Polyangiaceae bacterium]|jgi:purine-binding chemotaxis protein CheW|nr:chemotaxis protein CheW [Polyangiaceae bacterium]